MKTPVVNIRIQKRAASDNDRLKKRKNRKHGQYLTVHVKDVLQSFTGTKRERERRIRAALYRSIHS